MLLCRVFRSAVYPVQWMRLMVITCGMMVRRMGMLGISVKMEAITLTVKGK
jgi:predicted RND superfamily exporter protein